MGSTDTRYSVCTQAANGLIEYLMEVSKDGITLAQKCTPKAAQPVEGADLVIIEQQQRLYEGEKQEDGKNNMNLILGAFLPVTAIVSFIGGRVFASRRAQADQTREFMSDTE